MASERLIGREASTYMQMESEEPASPPFLARTTSSFFAFNQSDSVESTRIFEELPRASIVQVSRPDAGDISPMLLSYTIELQYKQVILLLFFPAIHFFF